jgi:thioesterase domain-containing protein
MMPALFIPLDAVPLTPNGKIDRKALPAPETVHRLRADAYVPPRNTLERQLADIWAEALGLERVGVHDNFFALGGDSLLTIRVVHLARQAGLALTPTELFEGQTIAALAQASRMTDGADANAMRAGVSSSGLDFPCLVPLQTRGDLPPFFCVHAATGTATVYRELALQLGQRQPFYGFQCPAILGAEEPRQSVEEMAQDYLTVIRLVQPAGPYCLGGWSFGGLVAYEIAQQLTQQGHLVSVLALLDTYPREVMPEVPCDTDATILLAAFAAHHDITLPLERLEHLDEDERFSYVARLGVSAGVFAHAITGLDVQRRFRVFVANVIAAQRYELQPYPGQITLIRAREALTSALIELSQRDLSCGWQRYTAATSEVHIVSGSHLTMVSEPHVSELATVLRATLERVKRLHEDSQ